MSWKSLFGSSSKGFSARKKTSRWGGKWATGRRRKPAKRRKTGGGLLKWLGL